MNTDLTLTEVFRAYYDCRKHKRNTFNAIEFEYDLERNLTKLYDELLDGSYRIGQSICFVVVKPKVREVWASNFRDRIVHHIVYNRYSPMFYRSFIYDSYACIPEKGTLRAAERVQQFIRSATENHTKEAFYLKADVANFFMSINKSILDTIITEKITDPYWLNLTRQILHHNPRTNVHIKSSSELMNQVPFAKSLFNTPEGYGLPIGNLSSQFFANVYMNELDQYAKHKLKAKYYARYVDDIVMIDNDCSILNDKYDYMNEYVSTKLDLKFHPNKKDINKVVHGVNFVGYIIKPRVKYIRRSTINNAYQNVKGSIDIRASVNSYLGILRNANCFNERCKLTNYLSEYRFDKNLTKMETTQC